MRTALTILKSPAFISLLIILPFMVMEVVKRRNFDEGFPFMLFFVLWFNLFAINIILVPIMRARSTTNNDMANSTSALGDTLFTNPRSTLLISAVLVLFIATLAVLSSRGWNPLDRLFNGPDPEQPYLPGQILSLALMAVPTAAGIIAGRPIIRTLRAGGNLFAHPFHLIIIFVISFLIAAGIVGLIVDQWPCFIGVPGCD